MVTDRGRPVAMLVRIPRRGLAKLEAEGRLRRGTGRFPRIAIGDDLDVVVTYDGRMLLAAALLGLPTASPA
jgi:antitoxin (DNA-binding transcriptional repressor) of toxin-antitoxin stability system